MSEPTAPPPTPIESWEVLDLLTSLVQKSLVVYEEDERGQGRYRLPEPMRQYARERLLEAGEADALRERHRDWFLALAEQGSLQGEDERTWLERLEREQDNLRAALAWSREQGEAEAGLRLGRMLGGFWHLRGYFGEGRQHLAGLLALAGAEARTPVRAGALREAGILARYQGEYEAARALLEESLAINREREDKAAIAGSLISLGWAARDQGEYGAARALRGKPGDQPGAAGQGRHSLVALGLGRCCLLPGGVRGSARSLRGKPGDLSGDREQGVCRPFTRFSGDGSPHSVRVRGSAGTL